MFSCYNRSPISSRELLPLMLLKGAFSFVYTILLVVVDSYIVIDSGAEAIAWLKPLLFPVSLCFTWSYIKLSKCWGDQQAGLSLLAFFAAVILLYVVVLLPYEETFRPEHTFQALMERFGVAYRCPLLLYRHWSAALLYLITQLWGQMVMVLLYWNLVNSICTIEQARHCYSLLIGTGCLSGTLGSLFGAYYTCLYADIIPFVTIAQRLLGLLFLVTLGGLFYFQRIVARNPCFFLAKDKKATVNTSWRQSVALLLKTPHLLFIGVMVAACGLATNLTEVTWKAGAKILYPTKEAYMVYTARIFSLYMALATISAFSLSHYFLRRCSWRFSAHFTPLVVGSSGVLFLLASIGKYRIALYLGLNFKEMWIFVISLGAFHYVLAKVARYTFFDPTKEMVYIPLSLDQKLQGKAAVDVTGAPLGKLGAALIHTSSMWFLGTASVLHITPVFLCCFLIAIFAWGLRS